MAGVGSPLRAIRAKCLAGLCRATDEGSPDCRIQTCALWPFRMGTNPNRKGLAPRSPDFVKREGAKHRSIWIGMAHPTGRPIQATLQDPL
jgi:hypothetical protein